MASSSGGRFRMKRVSTSSSASWNALRVSGERLLVSLLLLLVLLFFVDDMFEFTDSTPVVIIFITNRKEVGWSLWKQNTTMNTVLM